MSVSNALQKLVFDRLLATPAVTGLIGQRVFDHPPADAAFPYVSFGASDYQPDDMECISGRIETLQVDIWSRAQDGKREAKMITDAVKTSLHLYPGEPEVGALVLMRVDMVRMMDDPDGITSHGIVQIEAHLEE